MPWSVSSLPKRLPKACPRPVPPEESLYVQTILDGIYRSQAAGAEVAVSLGIRSKDGCTIALVGGGAHPHPWIYQDTQRTQGCRCALGLGSRRGARRAAVPRTSTRAGRRFLEEIWQDPDIRAAVVICSETDRHLELVTAGAQAGKHLFVEKPLGLGVAGRCADGSRASSRPACSSRPATSCAVIPIYRFLKEQIAAGALGTGHPLAHEQLPLRLAGRLVRHRVALDGRPFAGRGAALSATWARTSSTSCSGCWATSTRVTADVDVATGRYGDVR